MKITIKKRKLNASKAGLIRADYKISGRSKNLLRKVRVASDLFKLRKKINSNRGRKKTH